MVGMPTKYANNVVACKLWDLVNDNSPIEFIFGVAIFEQLNDIYDGWPCRVFSNEEFKSASWTPNNLFAIVPEFDIPGVGHVDFGIFVPQVSTEEPLLVVECDGHYFHERTPAQACEDKRRERTLQRRCIPCLRFTGTEIMRSSGVLAWEVAEFVHFKLHKLDELIAVRAELDAVSTELHWARAGALE
jgi:hypothetical protein